MTIYNEKWKIFWIIFSNLNLANLIQNIFLSHNCEFDHVKNMYVINDLSFYHFDQFVLLFCHLLCNFKWIIQLMNNSLRTNHKINTVLQSVNVLCDKIIRHFHSMTNKLINWPLSFVIFMHFYLFHFHFNSSISLSYFRIDKYDKNILFYLIIFKMEQIAQIRKSSIFRTKFNLTNANSHHITTIRKSQISEQTVRFDQWLWDHFTLLISFHNFKLYNCVW